MQILSASLNRWRYLPGLDDLSLSWAAGPSKLDLGLSHRRSGSSVRMSLERREISRADNRPLPQSLLSDDSLPGKTLNAGQQRGAGYRRNIGLQRRYLICRLRGAQGCLALPGHCGCG